MRAEFSATSSATAPAPTRCVLSCSPPRRPPGRWLLDARVSASWRRLASAPGQWRCSAAAAAGRRRTYSSRRWCHRRPPQEGGSARRAVRSLIPEHGAAARQQGEGQPNTPLPPRPGNVHRNGRPGPWFLLLSPLRPPLEDSMRVRNKARRQEKSLGALGGGWWRWG